MQQIPNYLNARQKLFCHWFALTRDAQGAADRCFRAPEKREEALLLLQTPLAQDYLRQGEAAWVAKASPPPRRRATAGWPSARSPMPSG